MSCIKASAWEKVSRARRHDWTLLSTSAEEVVLGRISRDRGKRLYVKVDADGAVSSPRREDVNHLTRACLYSNDIH